jgi:hypothetical protein
MAIFDDDEREKLQHHWEQIERDLPELRERAREIHDEMRSAALHEPNVSGQLRRAIASSDLDVREIAQHAGISAKTLAEFLVGASVLDSATIDRLAALLDHELKPVA